MYINSLWPSDALPRQRYQSPLVQDMMTSSNGNISVSPASSPHKGQWCGALMFSLTCAWTNAWANHRDAGDLISHGAHYEALVTCLLKSQYMKQWYISTRKEIIVTIGFCEILIKMYFKMLSAKYRQFSITLGTLDMRQSACVILVVADTLPPNKHQGISNSHCCFHCVCGVIWILWCN